MIRSRIVPLVGLGAAAAALLAFAPAREARADLVQTLDGEWFPPLKDVKLGPDDEPSDEVLRETADFKVDATYETVIAKSKGFSKPAGQVKRILSSDRATNEEFRKALVAAASDFFAEAADGFAAAAATATGFGKQDALYMKVVSLANSGDAEKTLAAIEELLVAFPKSFYLADCAILRAKAASGDSSAVRKALDAAKAAPGMNTRDLFRLEYTRIWLTEEASTAKDYDKARDDYLKLIAEIEKTPGQEGAVTRQRALVGVGNCYMRKQKAKEAEAFYSKATAESRNADVLAGAYNGLGSISFGIAKQLQEEKKLPEAKEKLLDAAEHYLRVSLLYRNDVDDMAPVLDALENQAKVYVALFDMSGGKDCEAARRAYTAYYDLQNLMPEGIQKKRLKKEGFDFGERKKAAGCGG